MPDYRNAIALALCLMAVDVWNKRKGKKKNTKTVLT
jgi:hypothetical protein